MSTIDTTRDHRNTLVIFASDNGGTHSARNDPLSGYKGSTYEGGIRVPAIVHWPGVVPAGRVSHQPCITFDFTASIARIAEIEAAADKPWEGIDIVQHVAEGRPDFGRTLYWRKPRGDTVWHGLREGDLKFVARDQAGTYTEYLFNLANDESEHNDLKDQRPDDLKRLKNKYLQWEAETRRHRRGRPLDAS